MVALAALTGASQVHVTGAAPVINSFTADFREVGMGDTVTLRWLVSGATTITLSEIGDVTAVGSSGSTNVIVIGVTNFVLIASDSSQSVTSAVSILVLPGVSSDWHLIQRFDGLFSDTINDPVGGINSNSWISSGADFSGSFDKWNVFTIINSGASNKVLTPRTGYKPDANSISGYDSRGALSYGRLGSLTMSPGQSNTVFFRFALRETPTAFAGVYSDLDFGVGLTDYNFIGPTTGLGYYGGNGQGIGPYFSIIRNSGGNFNGGPFDLFAPDTADPADGNTNGSFSYIVSMDPNGLRTNANYLVWMDILNRNTHAAFDTNSMISNTVEQATLSVWLQKQGESSRTLLFSNFHGNRSYVSFGPISDLPTPFLDKVFFNIGSESVVAGAAGSYFTTNMIAIDDIYLSTSGFKSSIPKLLELSSIVRGLSDVTIRWHSFGSLFQTNTYTVQRKFDLAEPGWTTIATVPSGGDSTTYVDGAAGSSSAYYRIVWP